MLEALNADDKDLIDEYSYRLFTFLESAQRTSNAERCVLLSKEDGISRDFRSEIYILSSTPTVGTFVALK